MDRGAVMSAVQRYHYLAEGKIASILCARHYSLSNVALLDHYSQYALSDFIY